MGRVIGLFDFDLLSGGLSFVPNLDLMKLSTYYKQSNNIVKMILNANKAGYFTDILTFKEKVNNSFPDNIIGMNNVQFYGAGFNGGRRVELNEEIERLSPDPTMYENIPRHWLESRYKIKAIKNFFRILNSQKARITYNGKLIDYVQLDFLAKNGETATIYDNNLRGLTGINDYLKYYFNGKSILFIYPLLITDLNEMLQLVENDNIIMQNTIVYDKKIDYAESRELAQSLNLKREIQYNLLNNIADNCDSRSFAIELEYALRLGFRLMTNNHNILPICSKDSLYKYHYRDESLAILKKLSPSNMYWLKMNNLSLEQLFGENLSKFLIKNSMNWRQMIKYNYKTIITKRWNNDEY